MELSHSYVFVSDPDPNSPVQAPRDDYLVQSPSSPNGEIIFGGGRRFALGLGVNQSSDSELEPAVALYLRSELTPVLDLTPNKPAETITTTATTTATQPLKPSHEWTGVMGYSRDLHPWVGPVPASLGGGDGRSLFVCAGYTGHGMPCAPLSGRHVARQMLGLGGEKKPDVKGRELPREFGITEQRVKRAREELPPVEGGWEVNTFGTLLSGVLSGEEKGEGGDKER